MWNWGNEIALQRFMLLQVPTLFFQLQERQKKSFKQKQAEKEFRNKLQKYDFPTQKQMLKKMFSSL